MAERMTNKEFTLFLKKIGDLSQLLRQKIKSKENEKEFNDTDPVTIHCQCIWPGR
ncbi:MAG: hypothetical protein Roseis2KO_06960 [Roseivirga sp.]